MALVVGIAGGTASGKTTVARKIVEAVHAGKVAFLEQDSYYRDLSDVPLEERAHHQHWSWIDEPAGILRARTFVGRIGIPEDEATGAAAIHQAQRLGREVTIHQGRGSVLHVRPAKAPGWSEVGGRVITESSRVIEL